MSFIYRITKPILAISTCASTVFFFRTASSFYKSCIQEQNQLNSSHQDCETAGHNLTQSVFYSTLMLMASSVAMALKKIFPIHEQQNLR